MEQKIIEYFQKFHYKMTSTFKHSTYIYRSRQFLTTVKTEYIQRILWL